MLYHKKWLQNLGPCPHNINTGLWQCSPMIPQEFCSLTGDLNPNETAYNTSLELPALASSNIQVEAQDPGMLKNTKWDCPSVCD